MTTLAGHQHTTARWATAWTQLLEAHMTPALLAEGRTLLDGPTNALQVDQGFASTKITTHAGELRPRIDVPQLTETAWDAVYEAIAAQPHIITSARTQAVTDVLTDPQHTAGIPILPAAEELTFTCSCQPEPGPCPHTAALGQMIANRARTVPIVLFTLRGRAHQHLKTYLRRRGNTAAQPQPAPTSPETLLAPPPVFAQTVPAQDARYRPVYLPHTPPLAGGPTTPVLESVTERPPASCLPLQALSALVHAAADRATELLNGVPDPSAGLAADLARFTASTPGEAYTEQAAHQLGLPYAQMRQLTAAHRCGGNAAVETFLYTTDPGPEILAQAEDAIQPLRPSPFATLARDGNRLTDPAARIQLRYGPDRRWHPYIEQFGDWRVVPEPHSDPARAYKAARAALRR
ncbi:hypothetical protein ACFV9E_14880 [Streptomyces sp. NPDC059835]|uniref:hypothetical protein n=1 Tax=Streptomyces sp. NPDC059835 TaxID=3346967 RepID=UPI0036472E0C